MAELVTVIVPVYNTEKQLERCVHSLLNQTYKALEILLVDDGSTDNSPAICDRLAKEDSRIRVIHKENGGVSDARNRGLDEATGGYVAFVDSDDWVEEDMISGMLAAAEEQQVPLVVCNYMRTAEEKEAGALGKSTGQSSIEQENIAQKKVQELSSKKILQKYLLEDKEIRIPHSVWGKLFKRELIGEKRFPLIKRTEELLFSTEIFCQAKKCAYVPQAFYHYCDDREDSLMHDTDAAHTVQTEIPLLLQQVEMIEKAGFSEEAKLAGFCFGKRLMYFYLAFRDKMLKQEALLVKKFTKRNRERIMQALKGSYVKKTDRLRIGMFVLCPAMYYRFVLMHDR